MSTEQTATPKPRYHGFTCPECGHHEFGTHTQHSALGRQFCPGVKVGSCHSSYFHSTTCTFTWNRDDPEIENKVMYEQTPEEWAAEHKTFLNSIKD